MCLDIHSFGYTRNQSFFLEYGEQLCDVLDIILGKRRNCSLWMRGLLLQQPLREELVVDVVGP